MRPADLSWASLVLIGFHMLRISHMLSYLILSTVGGIIMCPQKI